MEIAPIETEIIAFDDHLVIVPVRTLIQKKMKLTIENLEKCLSKIDYSIKGKTPNRFIYNHKNKNTYIRVWNETIVFEMETRIKTVAVMDRCTISMLSKQTVMLGNNKLFIQLHNFDKD